jgi:hypothetical protein
MTLAAPAFKGILGDRLAGRNEVWPHAARVSRVVQRPANASRPLSGTISSRLPAGLSQLIEDRDDPGSAQAMSASERPRTKTSRSAIPWRRVQGRSVWPMMLPPSASCQSTISSSTPKSFQEVREGRDRGGDAA